MASSTKIFKPMARWCQTKQKIMITFDVCGARDLDISVSEKEVKFSCADVNKDKYEFTETLREEVDPETKKVTASGRFVVLEIDKKDQTLPFWTHLIQGDAKPYYIKTDYTHLVDESEEEEDKYADGFPPGMNGFDFGNFGDEGYNPDDDDEEDHEEKHDEEGDEKTQPGETKVDACCDGKDESCAHKSE